MSTIDEIKRDTRDFAKMLVGIFSQTFKIIQSLWRWLVIIVKFLGRLVVPIIKGYVVGVAWLARLILSPVKLFFPYRLDRMFKYRFDQLFINKDYWRDVKEALFRDETDPEKPYLRWLFILAFLCPISLPLALFMFVSAYKNLRLMEARVYPYLHGNPKLIYVAMIFGAMIPLYLGIIFGPVVIIPVPIFLYHYIAQMWSSVHGIWNGVKFGFGMIMLAIGAVIAAGVALLTAAPLWLIQAYITFSVCMSFFDGWRARMAKYIFDVQKFGSAHWASAMELAKSLLSGDNAKGIYVGGGRYYNKSGHILTKAGTRGGKGTNLIIPNLTKIGRFKGSWVVIDPKGENAAVTARIQREMGRKVIILNPWNLLVDEFPHLKGMCYNPLDLIADTKDDNFVDDAQIIAEMIVPMKSGGNRDDFFEDRARAIVAGLIMHIVDSEPAERKNLGTLYEVTRMNAEDFIVYCGKMAASDIQAVKAIANEIDSLRSSEKTYGAVMGSVYNNTDILKSPPLQRSLASSDFKASDLTDGNTTVYIIIPADKLLTHGHYLRLVVTTTLRAVIRKPNKDVCFLLDEFYALGYISEVKAALGAYAGYGVHIWAVVQSLIQLQDMYGDLWENFIGSCSVRQFFNMADNFSTEYLSTLFGQTTIPETSSMGSVQGAQGRPLINADELRVTSGDEIFLLVDQLPPARLPKLPYYKMPDMIEGVDYDPNPYWKGEEQ